MVLRIFKMIASSGFLTALECTKFVFSRDSAPDPAEEAYSAPPDSLLGLRGPASKGREKGGKGEWKGRAGKGKRREGMGCTGPPFGNYSTVLRVADEFHMK